MKPTNARIALLLTSRVVSAIGFVSAIAVGQQPVDVVKVVVSQPDRRTSLPGEFLPYQSVAIYPKVTGFVERVEVDRGTLVRKDQLLAKLVAPELKSQILEAEAKVQTAESQRAVAEARFLALQSTFEKLRAAAQTPGVISGNELVLAEKEVDGAQAQVRSSESMIKSLKASAESLREIEGYLTVSAPFAGVITERNIHPGALVGPNSKDSGQGMFHLEQISMLRLLVAVPEVDVSGIVAGAAVSFVVPALPGQTFQGRIARIARSMDPKTRSMAVELDVPNPKGMLAPGMYPTVSWPVRKAQGSILVPPTSVVTTTERAFVIRVKDGEAEWVPVSKGAPIGDLIEVFGSLRAGDLIVRRGSDETRQGTKIRAQLAAK